MRLRFTVFPPPRSGLDAAQRPQRVGGLQVLAEAFAAEIFFEADDPVPGLGWFSQVIDQHVVETTFEESSEAR